MRLSDLYESDDRIPLRDMSELEFNEYFQDTMDLCHRKINVVIDALNDHFSINGEPFKQHIIEVFKKINPSSLKSAYRVAHRDHVLKLRRKITPSEYDTLKVTHIYVDSVRFYPDEEKFYITVVVTVETGERFGEESIEGEFVFWLDKNDGISNIGEAADPDDVLMLFHLTRIVHNIDEIRHNLEVVI